MVVVSGGDSSGGGGSGGGRKKDPNLSPKHVSKRFRQHHHPQRLLPHHPTAKKTLTTPKTPHSHPAEELFEVCQARLERLEGGGQA